MLAQWVPLHAVSCSNLIETGGCAESREIPLRVTQAWPPDAARAIVLSLSLSLFPLRTRSLFVRSRASRSRIRRMETPLIRVSDACSTIAPPHVRARAHRHTRTPARVSSMEIGTWRTQNRDSRSERPRSSSARISSRGKSLPTIVVSLTVAEDRLVDILRLDPATLRRSFTAWGKSTLLRLSLSRSR